MAFDTLTYAKKLQEAGVPIQQAEAHAGALKELVEDNLATKRDIKELEAALRHEIELLRRELKQDIELVRRDILIKLGGIVVAGVTVLAALIGVVIAMIGPKQFMTLAD